jgi:pseudouridine-5'-phosphate glycosidase
MKKFGVSSDWLAKRSNSIRQTSYSRSSLKSNTNQLDAMIKSASAKPIRSNRKLSFIENPTPMNIEIDQENTDPLIESTEKNKEEAKTPCKKIFLDI